nr:hypothetical protein [uncultured Campylobacter sp.]
MQAFEGSNPFPSATTSKFHPRKTLKFRFPLGANFINLKPNSALAVNLTIKDKISSAKIKPQSRLNSISAPAIYRYCAKIPFKFHFEGEKNE